MLKWDETTEKLYEVGVDRGVYYPMDDTGKYGDGEAWNGLTEVGEKPSGAEATKLWANNHNYLTVYSQEEFGFSITAYTNPDGFFESDGAAEIAKGVYARQQKRRKFGFSWRSLIGNDVQGSDYGYKIHICYGCMASPSEKTDATINDSSDIPTLSWECTTEPVNVAGFRPTAHIEIWSTNSNPAKLKDFEELLYGGEGEESKASLPSIEDIVRLFGDSAVAG